MKNAQPPSPKPTAGVFIDGANLYYSQRKSEWKIDLVKLKRYLKTSFKLMRFCYYAAVPNTKDSAHLNSTRYLKKISAYVSIHTKPLKYIYSDDHLIKKGNVDIEIALDVVRNLDHLDVIIILTGDSDFVELRRYVLENHKQIVFLGFHKTMAWELKQGKYFYLDSIKSHIIQGEKTTPRTKPGRLLVNLLYQKRPRKSTKL